MVTKRRTRKKRSIRKIRHVAHSSLMSPRTKTLVSILVIALLAGTAYFAWKHAHLSPADTASRFQAPLVTEKANDSSFFIPELRVRFKEIGGLTLNYSVKDDGSVAFSSGELATAAENDSGLAGCATTVFPAVSIELTPTGTLGTDETKLADGRYLLETMPVGTCSASKATAADKALATSQATVLFPKFFATAEAY